MKAAFESTLDAFDAETVTINGASARGVVEDIGAELLLGEGGDNRRRALRVAFPSAAFTTVPTAGKRATCRSLTWQITRVDNGPGSLVIEMEEPERRG